ncbi:PqqD family protein [bacterium]|nr:PqqD family protein [bacterium]
MNTTIDLSKVFRISEDVVTREIEGEVIIVPLISGIGDLEDELYTLNETGRKIWEKLDGHLKLEEIISELTSDYLDSDGELEKDVIGFVTEMIKRKMVVEV